MGRCRVRRSCDIPEPGIPKLIGCERPVSWGPGVPGGKCDVIGNILSTAWYAAVRGLPRCRDLSNRSLIHHSTLSQSMHGSSMTLAKCILSQNVRRVRVCKRHLLPARDREVPDAADDATSWRVFQLGNICHHRFEFKVSQVHFAAPLWILNPSSQITPHSSRATATLILL